MKTKGLLFCAVLLIQFIAGCATVPMATETEDLEAKSFNADTGKSNIYVFRDSIVGTAVTYEIILDGEIIGNLPIKTFHLLEVAPGKHIVAASFRDSSDLVELAIEPGQNYFIRASFSSKVVGAYHAVKVEVVNETEAKEIILQLKLAKSSYN